MRGSVCSTVLAVGVAMLASLFGLFLLTPYPKQWGFYRWQAEQEPLLFAFTPAHYYGIDWKFTFADLEEVDLSDQHALVTGANSGIGYEIAKGLVKMGAASVTLACRNPTKCDQVVRHIRSEVPAASNTDLRTLIMDTSSLSSVQRAAYEYRQNAQESALDMLFLNAGIAFTDTSHACVPLSEDGIELSFATNHVGHHLLYRLLEPLLQRSTLARVVSTTSNASYKTFSYIVATDLETLNGCSEEFFVGPENYSYGQSKLAQILWTKQLARRLGPQSTIYVNAFHPGMVDTKIWHHILDGLRVPKFVYGIIDWFRRDVMWTAREGALTGLVLGAHKELVQRDDLRALYYHPQGEVRTNPLAKDEDLQKAVWDFTDSLVRDFLPTEAD